ncbi:hypothetical protein SKAU_G00334440 [Synaphobranchus kaupii]|uniref:Uncharacterized protein n=1 Tax=Synaphobranchus kaupii TaxID=118154 RepID=A0A9Q1ELT5_SYNKA|nr:hypothetical protein SKAU_G00334440 [Synaphobranchus kaupii]
MSSCGSCLFSILWLIILLALAWPLSIFLGGLYGFIAPLTTCVGLDRLTDLLLEGANLGRTCALNVRHGRPLHGGRTPVLLAQRKEGSLYLKEKTHTHQKRFYTTRTVRGGPPAIHGLLSCKPRAGLSSTHHSINGIAALNGARATK